MAVVVSVLPCADSVLVCVVLCGVHLPFSFSFKMLGIIVGR